MCPNSKPNLKLGQTDVDNEKTKTNLSISDIRQQHIYILIFIFKIQLCLDYFR